MGAVRLFLALVVAYDHWRTALAPRSIFLDSNLTFGFNAGFAVIYFYVVSGFLITYGLRHKYESDTKTFYKARFIRIFSLYWPLVLVMFLLVPGSWARFVAASPLDHFTGIFLIGIDWSLTFSTYPALNFNAMVNGLSQAWTLGAELVFYIFAPWLMRSWKIGAALLALSFGARAAFVIANGPGIGEPPLWTYTFAVTTFGFFMLGHLVCLASQRWAVLSRPALGFVLLIISFGLMNEGGRIPAFDTPYFWGSVLCFTLSLPGLFEATKSVAWLNALGGLSYPLYLVHYAVMGWLDRPLLDMALGTAIASPLAIGYGSMTVFLLASILAAAVAHKLLEEPVANLMRAVRIPRWA
jgi:peptidoglycan/LPS O-acetylase OafA/YrhL